MARRRLDSAVSLVYATCVVRRLAIFNRLAGELDYFLGLPVTYVSLVLPFMLIVPEFLEHTYVIWLARILMLALSLLFTSSLKIPKPGKAAYFVYPGISIFPLIVWILGRR